MKSSKRILTVLSIFVLFSVTVTAQGSNWQENPTLCPTEYAGVTDDGYVCGVTSNNDPDFYDWGGVPSVGDTTTNRGSQIAGVNGGFVVDCYARSGSEPYCDNGGNFWCSPQQSCLDDQVKTLCTDFASESNSAQCTDECRNGFVQCAFDDNGEATPKSANFDTREALTDDFSGQSNMCDTRVNQRAYPGEDSSGTEYNSNLASSNHEIVVDNSCQPACQSGYFNDDGDVSTGCEIEQGGFCQVEGVEGEWSCSGDPLNNADCFCQTDPVPFETDVNTTYSAETSLLWGYQLHPLGHLALLQSQKGGLFIVDNDGNIGISGDIYYNVTNVTNQTLNETGPSINFENLFEAGEDKVFETDEALVRGEQEGTGDLLELSSNEGTFVIYRNGTITFDDGSPGGPEPVIQSLADVLNQGNTANQDIDLNGNTLVNVGEITGADIIGNDNLKDDSVRTQNIQNNTIRAEDLKGTPTCGADQFLRWDGTNNFQCVNVSIPNVEIPDPDNPVNLSNVFEAGEQKQFNTTNALVTAEQTGSGDLLRLSSPDGEFVIYRNGTITFDDGSPGGPEPVIQSLADVLNQGNIANQDIDVDGNTLVNVGEISGSNIIGTINLAPGAVHTENIEEYAVQRDNLDQDAVGTGKIEDGAVTGAKIASGTITAQELSGTPSCDSNQFLQWNGSEFVCLSPEEAGVTPPTLADVLQESNIATQDINMSGNTLQDVGGIVGENIIGEDNIQGDSISPFELQTGAVQETHLTGDVNCEDNQYIVWRGGLEPYFECENVSENLGLESTVGIQIVDPDSTIGSLYGLEGPGLRVRGLSGLQAENDGLRVREPGDGMTLEAGRLDVEAGQGLSQTGNGLKLDAPFLGQSCPDGEQMTGITIGGNIDCTGTSTSSDGVCGDRAQTYSSDTTSWPAGSEYCTDGTASSTPGFPDQGETVTWTCQGEDGGSDDSCSAYRAEAPGTTAECDVAFYDDGEGCTALLQPTDTNPCDCQIETNDSMYGGDRCIQDLRGDLLYQTDAKGIYDGGSITCSNI